VLDSVAASASVQMYLVSILRLAEQNQPVPLSQLAAVLDVSPVSANQMCRRLEEEGLVTYVPYKGVSITPTGEQLAVRILRRHRLWEVFLVERLQIGSTEAHDMACSLEHATSDLLAERLAAYLSHPQVNPEGEPIPDSSGQISARPEQRLIDMEAGQSGHCIRCTADEASCAFLSGQGLRPGASLMVIATAPRSVLLQLDGKRIALTHDLAETVLVEIKQLSGNPDPASLAESTSTPSN